jgi:diguanylate cyclase (GGDEF)-like protein
VEPGETSIGGGDFADRLRGRNAAALRLGSALGAVLVPAFYVLDFYVIPDHVRATLLLRAAVSAYAAALVALGWLRPATLARHADALSLSLTLVVSWMISVLCWLGDGYESPYAAGLNLVFITAALLFSWRPRLVFAFQALVYGFHMAPLVVGRMDVRDPALALSHQFFILSTMLVTFVSQRHRFLLERREHASRVETERLLEEVRLLVTRDTLTPLHNRRHLFATVEAEIARARRYGRPLAVLMIDVDGFKLINDTSGHAAGDAVLQAVADRIVGDRRPQDTAARYGGDEIVVVLPEADAEAAQVVAERLRAAVEGTAVPTPGGPLGVTLSIGVAALDESVADVAALLHRADEALYRAKRSGRNRSMVWSGDGADAPRG